MEIALVIQIIEALAALVVKTPEIVAAVEATVNALRTGKALTPDQQAAIDALLEKRHGDLQAPLAPSASPPPSAGTSTDAAKPQA